jgi:protein arginine kinase
MMHIPLETTKITQQLAPWDHNENSIWLASSLALHRNIEKFKFPGKLEQEKKTQLLSLLINAFLQGGSFDKPFAIHAEEISPLERNFLLEHFLIFESIHDPHPGEGFILDSTGQFLAVLNFKDHLALHVLDVRGDLEKTWQELVGKENTLQKSLNFAFSQKFGFLTSDPSNCGTGLIVTAFLHLPALIHLDQLKSLLEAEKNEATTECGLQGNPEELVGDILTIRNAYTLGVNEENIIGTLRSTILKLVLAEKSARSHAKQEGSQLLQDKISRALGTLKYSYQLETPEALSSLSLIKLGIELGYIKEMSIVEINKLFFTCRHAHLAWSLKEQISNEELPAKRATFLREKVKNLVCTF